MIKRSLLFLFLGMGTCFAQTSVQRTPTTGTVSTGTLSNGGFHVPSGQTITIDSGATIANNGTATGFGGGSGTITIIATGAATGTAAGSGTITISLVGNYGSSANTIAQGNDTRFPASVTGIRLGAGAGSSDTALSIGNGLVLMGGTSLAVDQSANFLWNGLNSFTHVISGTITNAQSSGTVTAGGSGTFTGTFTGISSGTLTGQGSGTWTGPVTGTATFATTAGSTGSYTGNALQAFETRMPSIAIIEQQIVAASGTITLMSVTGGPGNVDALQLAIGNSDVLGATQNSTINITVDGTALPAIPLRLWSQTEGTTVTPTGPTSCAPQPWATNRAAVYTYGSSFGCYRRQFIPYTSSCSITLVSGAVASTILVYSQVYYHSGAIPVGLYNPLAKVLHIAVTAPTSVVQYGSLQILSDTGQGFIDSLLFCAYQAKATAAIPAWLEGNPFAVVDTNTVTLAGGTEDFFGNQWDGSSQLAQSRNTDKWGMPVIRWDATNEFTTCYRNFIEDPIIFNSSIAMDMVNSGNGLGVGSVNMEAVVFYYKQN